jgi:hypothetical protein
MDLSRSLDPDWHCLQIGVVLLERSAKRTRQPANLGYDFSLHFPTAPRWTNDQFEIPQLRGLSYLKAYLEYKSY